MKKRTSNVPHVIAKLNECESEKAFVMSLTPVVIALRGLTREAGHSRDFCEALQSADATLTPHGIDLPGTGAFFALTSPDTIDGIAQHVARTLQAHALAQSPLYIVAQSMGAMVALALAARNDVHVIGMTLANTSLRQYSRFSERLQASQWWSFVSCVMRWNNLAVREQRIAAMVSQQPLAAETLAQLIAIQQAHPVSRATLLAQLRAAITFAGPTQPPAPVQLLCSQHDKLVAPVCSRRLAQQWQCSLHVQNLAGHDLLRDAPQWCAERVHVHVAQIKNAGKK